MKKLFFLFLLFPLFVSADTIENCNGFFWNNFCYESKPDYDTSTVFDTEQKTLNQLHSSLLDLQKLTKLKNDEESNENWKCGEPYILQGKSHNTLAIAGKCWFVDNVKVETTTSYCLNNDCEQGVFYPYNEENKNICSGVFRLPSTLDFYSLESFYADSSCDMNRISSISYAIGGNDCSPARNSLTSTVFGGDNSSGFSSNYLGIRQDSAFYHQGNRSYYMSSNSYDSNNYILYAMQNNDDDNYYIRRLYANNNWAVNIRCVSDEVLTAQDSSLQIISEQITFTTKFIFMFLFFFVISLITKFLFV